jgi:GDP-L-fucose synthase
MNKNSKIYIAGHTGLVGSSIVRKLEQTGYSNLLLKTRADLDLLNQDQVNHFFNSEKPEYVIDAAAKVGGIQENIDHPATFLYDNLQIQNNLMWAAKINAVKSFLFIGSSTIYARESIQPMTEDGFTVGKLDPTNEAYATSKVMGMKLCEYIHDEFGLNFTSCMPTNLYGEYDNFDSKTAHVIPSLIHRMHEAKINNIPEVVIWGTGMSRREFLHVDDLADAIIWLVGNYNQRQFLNIGTGEDISIKELAEKIKKLTNYKGSLVFDASKPEGVPRRLLDVSKIHKAGWHHQINLDEGMKRTYDWYLNNLATTVG